ncbi:hypothetical protein K523DRAFT_364697 [Schizophyllum commune Tattone D]|nr:hypothetical protein K523DRAFT_364697 [Schizophyllum commune Tattone D]
MDDISTSELEQLLKDVQTAKDGCATLKPLSEKFISRWNPVNIMAARDVTRRCKRVLDSCQSASNSAVEMKVEKKIASTADKVETRTEVSVLITRAGQHASSTVVDMQSVTESPAPSPMSDATGDAHPGNFSAANNDDLDDLILWLDEADENLLESPSDDGIPMPPLQPDVLASSVVSPPTLIHIESRSTLRRRRAVMDQDDGESIYSRASSKRLQRWHVVRSPTQQQIMDDLSGLNFSNASVSSFLVSPDGVEELTGDAAFTSGQLSDLIHGAPSAEQVNETGLPQPTRRLRRQTTMMSLVSTTTLPEDFAAEKQDTISGLDIPFDGQSSLIA